MTDGVGESYTVVFPQFIRERLKGLIPKAQILGIGSEYGDILRTVVDRLTWDPIGWGDPNCRLHHMGLLKFNRLYRFFQIIYSVDEQRRLVYVTEFKPLPGHPLESSP